MARPTQILLVFAGTLFFLSGVKSQAPQPSPSLSRESFFVEGQVYCDTCRCQFINKLTEFMPGAEVQLQCRGEEAGNITYTVSGKTNDLGVYRVQVEGDHQDEICEIKLVKSTRKDCTEIPDEGWAKQSSRITLTSNNGIHGDIRQANPLGFFKDKSLSECVPLFKEMGILPPDL